MYLLAIFFALALLCTQQVAAQAVFAHVIVGNNGAYTLQNWQSDIRLASSKGIDAFALNIAPPLAGAVAEQAALAFQAANSVPGGFKLFFSFDYLGSGTPWSTGEIETLLNQYAFNAAHFKYAGRPFVSTFEGPSNSDVSQWATIRQNVRGGIYFVPDWTSMGPGYEQSLIDGAFSWNMWPEGPNNITTTADLAWQGSLKPAKKSYMMGVSPWYFTDLPAYHKAWVWRGDGTWYRRWRQVNNLLPQFVEIVTWNDFGESHYIGPIYEPGIPQAPNADARPYVNGYPHQAWLETLPWLIASYKHAYNPSNPAPTVAAGEDKIVYWYRRAPAAAGSTSVTGNACASSINLYPQNAQCYPVDEILEDGVWAMVFLSTPGSASIAIGDNAPQQFHGLVKGMNHISRPFNGQTGVVTVTSSTGVHGQGVTIDAEPPNGVANFNAWVGCAGECS